MRISDWSSDVCSSDLGQFAKPRSSSTETIDGVTLPSYRGDAVNGPAFDMASRTPDPRRLPDAPRQAPVTIDPLKAYAAAALAGPPQNNLAAGRNKPARPRTMVTSHQATPLN